MLQSKRVLIIQINDKSMKIVIIIYYNNSNFVTVISKRSRPTMDFAHECPNLQSKSADIEFFFQMILN